MTDLLGFGGRIGRLHFLFLSLALAAIAGAGVMAAVVATIPDAPAGSPPPGIPLATFLLGGLVGLSYLWASAALHAKRLRDIGLPPLPIILGWLAVTLLDGLIAAAVPAVALPHGGGTLLGLGVNLLLAIALLFWPGNGESDFVPIELGSRWRPPEPPAPTHRPASITPTAPAGFGRRGL